MLSRRSKKKPTEFEKPRPRRSDVKSSSRRKRGLRDVGSKRLGDLVFEGRKKKPYDAEGRESKRTQKEMESRTLRFFDNKKRMDHQILHQNKPKKLRTRRNNNSFRENIYLENSGDGSSRVEDVMADYPSAGTDRGDNDGPGTGGDERSRDITGQKHGGQNSYGADRLP
ncbi:MAG: hypothetical protein Q9169_004571 [Polycauliona sp. 2 TL-2023]